MEDPRYEKMFSSSFKRRLYFLSNRFGKYFGAIVTSLGENVIVEGLISAALILVVWLLFVRRLDVFEPEKWRYLLLTLIISMIFAESCFLLYDVARLRLDFTLEGSLFHQLMYCVFGIGLIEEFVKLMPVFIILAFTKEVNESVDYVIYASVAAIGFSFMENLGYFHEFGLKNIGGRAVACGIGHMAYSAIAIYGLVYARCRNKSRFFVFVSFFVACLFHGLYDFWIMADGLPDYAPLFSILMVILSIIVYKRIILNALNNSEFFDAEGAEEHLRKSGIGLIYGLSYVLVVEYMILAVKFGPMFANAQVGLTFFILCFLVLPLWANFSKYNLKQGRWVSLFAASVLGQRW